MPVSRRVVKSRTDDVPEWAWRAMYDEELSDYEKTCALFSGAPATLDQYWEQHSVSVLEDWIEEHPGTRPTLWWERSAPRCVVGSLAGRGYSHTGGPEPRRRVGGTGTPAYEVLNYFPGFHQGIPIAWVREWDVSYYNGRMRDVHGKPIGTEFAEGYFQGVAIDPDNPPTFESQASYLRRHGLLRPGEERRVPPAGWEPETVMVVASR